jgi:predicted dehydrogenase
MTSRMSRRRFLQAVSAAGAGYFCTAGALSARRAAAGPNGKLYLAGIGVGGKGSGDITQAGKLTEVVALCDIDDKNLAAKAKSFPEARKYFDFRKLLDEMGKDLDAVTVSTPDHTHAPAAIMAMRMKKHVYCQKPLTHTIHEARLMREVARQMGVATQMGNQGSAANGLRRAVEVVQAGGIGPVREAHVWTNRPIWPQAPAVTSRPAEKPLPAHVHWDEFIGPAPLRPYAEYDEKIKTRRKGAYHSFNWRGWWDFGTGALGDMACHTANLAFRALRLGYPISVLADATDVNPETYPSSAKIVLQFPAREELPPLSLTWYEGRRDDKKLQPPEELVQKATSVDTNDRRKGKLSDSGCILVGAKGILYAPNENGTEFVLYPAKDFEGLNRTKPEKLPPGVDGRQVDQQMKAEWIEAIKGGPPAYSNFDYAGLLTETVLLGNLAIRLTGEKLEWDGPGLKFTNSARANQYLHYEYRKGWTL